MTQAGGPPRPRPSQLRPVERADAACDADAERARPVGPVRPSYRRLERVPAAIPMGRGPHRATTSQAARRRRAEAAVPLPAWAPSRRYEPARRISVPSGFRGAHRTPQTSPALMTFIPCAPAPGRPGHPSHHLGKTLGGGVAARRKDLVSGASTGVDLPRPRSLRVPKGGKREGSEGGAGQAQAERAPRPLLLFKLGAAPALRGLTGTWEARHPCALRPSEPRACLASAKRTRCVTAHRTRGDMRGV